MSEINKDDTKSVPKEPVTGETMKTPKKGLSRVKATDADMRYKEMTLALADIQKDDELFGCRLKRDKATVEKYLAFYRENREAEANGEEPIHKIKSILVWWDKTRRRHVLLGGDHRLTAALLAGYTEMVVLVLDCSEDDAFTAASRDNATHGLGLSDGDKTYLVRKSLERFGDTKTFREIASDVGCAHSLVAKVYKELFGRKKRQPTTDGSEQKKPPTTPPDTDTSDGVAHGEEHKEPEQSDQERIQEVETYLNACVQKMSSPDYLYDWARRWVNLKIRDANKHAQSDSQA